METFLVALLNGLLLYGDVANDPIQESWWGASKGRQFECERLPQGEAHLRYPGDVPAPPARAGNLFGIDALVCKRMVTPEGARNPRDELILRQLSTDVAELSGMAANTADEDTRWVVDAFYPDLDITRKIAGASRVALAERGLKVSDRPPQFTAGDVEVFRSMPMRDAIPFSCQRWFDLRGQTDDPVRQNEAWLAIALLHEQESQLHAGVCQGGEFRWLR